MANEVCIRRDDAEKVAELLEGLATLLRVEPFPQRLFEAVEPLIDESPAAWSALRYDIHQGPGYVADEATAQARRIREALPPDYGGTLTTS